jgi:hypothetical protein
MAANRISGARAGAASIAVATGPRARIDDIYSIIRAINARGVTVFLVEQNGHQTLAISHCGDVLAKAAGGRSRPADELADREVYFSWPQIGRPAAR